MADFTRNAVLTELDKRGELHGTELAEYRTGLRTGQYHNFAITERHQMERSVLDMNPELMSDNQAQGASLAYLETLGGYQNSKQFFNKDMRGKTLFKAVQNHIDPKRFKELFKTPLQTWDENDEETNLKASYADSKNAADFRVNLDGPIGSGGALGIGGLAVGGQVVKAPNTRAKTLEELSVGERALVLAEGKQQAFDKSYTPKRTSLERMVKADPGAWAIYRESLTTGKLPKGISMGLLGEDSPLDYINPQTRAAVLQLFYMARPADATEGFFGTASEATRKFASAAVDIPVGAVQGLSSLGRQAAIGLYSMHSIDDAVELNKAMLRERKLAADIDMTLDFKVPEGRGRVGKAFTGLAETIPFMVSVAIPAGAVAAGLSVKSKVETQLESEGLEPFQAQLAGSAAGATAVLVERLMGVAGKGPLAKTLSKHLIAKSVSESLMKRMANMSARAIETGGKLWFEETLEEGIEGALNEVWKEAAQGKVALADDVKEAFETNFRESMDVTGLMAVFGVGGRAIKDLRSPAQTFEDNKGLEASFTQFSEDEVREFGEAFEVDLVKAWANAPTKKAAVTALKEVGMTDEQIKQFEPMLNTARVHFKELDALEKAALSDTKQDELDNKQFIKMEKLLTDAGYDVNIVDVLSAATDPDQVGQISGRTIELLSSAIDKGRIVTHEALHGAVELGLVTQQDLDVVLEGIAKPQYEAITEAYMTESGEISPEIWEDIAADIIATQPTEAGVLKRVLNAVKDFFGVITNESDVARKLERVLTKHAKSQKVGIVDKVKSAVGIKHARKLPQANASDLYSAAQAVASHMIKGGAIESVAKSVAKDVQVEPQIVINIAKGIYVDAMKGLDKEADNGAKRLAIKTAGVRARFDAERRKAIRTGFKQGVQAATAKAQLKERSKKRAQAEASMVAQNKELQGFAKENVRDVLSDKVSFENWFASVNDAVNEWMKSEKITSKTVRDASVKHIMYSQMYGEVKHMKHSVSKQHQLTKLNEMNKPGTGVDTAAKIAERLVARLKNIQYGEELQALKKDFSSILHAEAGKPLKQFELLRNRTISPEKHAELRLARTVAPMSAATIKKLQVRIATALELYATDKIKEAESFMAEVNEALPELSKLKLDQYQKLIIANAVIQNYGGVLASTDADIVAEALSTLQTDILEGTASVIKAAQEQAERINEAITKFGQAAAGHGQSSDKVASWFAGTFNIGQRARHMARFGPDSQKALMAEVMESIGVQSSYDEYQRQLIEKQKLINKLVKDTYKKSLLVVKRTLENTHDEWAKYDKLHNRAMSKGQMLQIASTWDQDEYKPNLKNMGYTQKLIDKMRSEFTAADNRLIQGLRQLYAEFGQEIDEVSMRHFGVPAANNSALYMPVAMFGNPIYNAAEVRKTPVLPPSLNERIENDNVSKVDTAVGILQMLASRMDENAHFISHADAAIMAQQVFGNKKLAERASITHGESWTGFREHMQDIMSNSRIAGHKDGVLRRLTSMYTMRALSTNLAITVKQITSVFAYAFHYGIWNGIKVVASGMTDGDYIESYKKLVESDQWKARYQFGMDDLVGDALRERYGTSNIDKVIANQGTRAVVKTMYDGIKNAYKFGMYTTKIGDAIPIATLGPIVYQAELKQADGNEELAMSRTWEIIQSTQQSSAAKDRNALSRRGGQLASMMGMFLNSPGQYFAFTSLAVQDVIAQPKSSKRWKKAADTLGVHLLLTGAYGGTGMLINSLLNADDDDEEWKLKFAVNTAAGLAGSQFMLNSFIEAGLESAVLGEPSYGKQVLPIAGLLDDAANFGALMRHLANRDVDEMLETVDDEIQNFIPVYRLGRKAVTKLNQ